MTVLVIRAHKRFAVRRTVRIACMGETTASGLLIELSLQGCRISNIGRGTFSPGECTSLAIDGFDPVPATIRWAHDGIVGLCFDRALHAPMLDRMIRACRGEDLSSGQPRRAASA